MVMAAKLLSCCICSRHLVVAVCHCPLPCYCLLCAITIALAVLAIARILAHHHLGCLCRPRDQPGGAGTMPRELSTPGKRHVLTWQGCCWHSCTRHHHPCQPTAAATAACQRRLRSCWQCGNKVNKDNNNIMTTTNNQHDNQQDNQHRVGIELSGGN